MFMDASGSRHCGHHLLSMKYEGKFCVRACTCACACACLVHTFCQRQTPSRPLRYRDDIGLDTVTLPNAPWDLRKVIAGTVELFLRPLCLWVQLKWRMRRVFGIS